MEYICGYLITFSDDGDPEFQPLHKGSKAECEEVLNLMCAVSYSGDRPVCKTSTILMPYEG